MTRRILLATWLAACSGDGSVRTPADGGSTARDAATMDAAARDTGPQDAAHADASPAPVPVDAANADGSAVAPPPGTRYFPDGAFLYQRVDTAALDPDSAAVTSWLEANGGWGTGSMRIDFSIEVLLADAHVGKTRFVKTGDFYTPDCDSAPVPVPAGGALEGEQGYACLGDGDCHLLVLAPSEQRLYEMWRANLVGGSFRGGCAVIWDTSRVYGPEGRGEQCTSADAGGFPIAPLLFSADEVQAGHVDHAVRFILPNERMRAKTYQHPGTHAGGPSGPSSAPIYGSRWRLKGDFDVGSLPNEGARTVARALQQYGMVLADGGNIALTAQSDRFTAAKWDGLLGPRDLGALRVGDFELVQTGEPIVSTNDCLRSPIVE